MKPIFLFILFSICVFSFSRAQNPLVKMWDYRYGGIRDENLTCLLQTSDGSIMLGGFSLSPISGDKTQDTIGKYDYWIIKIDSNGVKLWDKDFGGSDDDFLYSIIQTSDEGYLIGGVSYSGSGGTKSENSFDTSLSYFNRGDYWVIKLDSLGNKEWDKTFGGSYVDELRSLEQANDGGYIIGGFSYSGIGGNKTQPNWDTIAPISSDYWILKLDSGGNKLWEKVFGGTDYDHLKTVLRTKDDGFILGGESESGSNGNKTDVCWGYNDYWIIKIDSFGNAQWDKAYGGWESENFSDIVQTSDNGYTIEGVSRSGISGLKSQANWDPSGNTADYWLVKTDSLGNIQWERSFGGTLMEDGDITAKIISTLDDSYLITGNSYSQLSGDKTENNLGTEQTWILKTDLNGNKQWDKTIFTLGHDETASVTQTRDGCYIIANATNGGIGGYKTQPVWGNSSSDFWIVKFCDTTFIHANFTNSSTLCAGTCIDFINLSINATSYLWSFPGALPDTSTDTNPTNICYPNPGTYDVTLIASNANGSDTLTLQNYITVFPHPPAQSISQSGDTLFAIAGSSSYQWYFNGNSISGATDYFYVATASGDYNVVATDSNGCEVEAVINNVLASAQAAVGPPKDGFDEANSGSMQSIQVYPNPVSETLDIRGLEKNSIDEIKIFNVYGEKVFSAVIWKLGTVNCKLFPAGLYYLEITSEKKICFMAHQS